MSKTSSIIKRIFNYKTTEADINANFDLYLERLKAQSSLEWGILDKILRKYTVPWLIRKLMMSDYEVKKQIATEIYAESLQTYIKLFTTGEFSSVSNLVALMYSIADKKLKENFRKIKKDGRFVFTDNDEWMNSFEDPNWEKEKVQSSQNELLHKMKVHLRKLSKKDQEILLRYSNGEKLKDIALSMDIPQATCRKQKERALSRLRKLFFGNTIKALIGISWLINI